jgi:multiple sugar transport system permease protein
VSQIDWVQGHAQWRYVGLDQYRRVIADALFRAGIVNTLIFAVGGVLVQMILGFALALWTTKVARGRVLYRTVFILPILVPGIVIGAIWKLMYNFDFGVLNQLLGLVDARPIDWLGNTATALAAVIAVDVWHWTPFVFLLMLAGLESLPQDVYEAAHVDGASLWDELRFVTLPLMLPTIVVTLMFRVIVGVKVFDEIYLLTGGGPGTSTEVVSYTIFRRFFTEGQTGYGSAMSVVVLFALALIFVVLQMTTQRRATVA